MNVKYNYTRPGNECVSIFTNIGPQKQEIIGFYINQTFHQNLIIVFSNFDIKAGKEISYLIPTAT